MSKILVIGYGNSLRCDDGVGQLVAIGVEKLNLPQVRSLYLHQLTPELAEKIAEFENVIFVDGGINMDKVKLIKLNQHQSNLSNNSWTHNLNPESLIYLTQFLYQKTTSAWLITIPINNLDFGENLSYVTQEGKKEAIIMVKNLIQEILFEGEQKLCTK